MPLANGTTEPYYRACDSNAPNKDAVHAEYGTGNARDLRISFSYGQVKASTPNALVQFSGFIGKSQQHATNRALV